MTSQIPSDNLNLSPGRIIAVLSFMLPGLNVKAIADDGLTINAEVLGSEANAAIFDIPPDPKTAAVASILIFFLRRGLGHRIFLATPMSIA